MATERSKAHEHLISGLQAGLIRGDHAVVMGAYTFVCRDRDGHILWVEEHVPNTVTRVGVAWMLDQTLRTPAAHVAPLLGLISGSGFTAVADTDTMGTHAGWVEAGDASPGPSFSGTRQTAVFSAAVPGALTTITMTPTLTFNMTTTTGTVQGAFIVYGTGAVATLESGAGVLLSAGAFGTPQPTVNGNVLTVSYSLSLDTTP